MSKTPVLYCDDGSEIDLPTKWEVCGSCEGRGTTSRHVECDGGGFTSSEWAEQDQDFREDYLAGRYDRACNACGGRTTVKVVDYDRMSPEQAAAYDSQLAADSYCRAEEMAERRMGC